MAKVQSSPLIISGSYGNGIIYHVPNGKSRMWLFRRKRGSVRPALLNAACEQSKNDLLLSNGYASSIHRALLPFLENISRQKLWNNLRKHVRAEMKKTGTPMLRSYRQFEICSAQRLTRLLQIEFTVKADWQAGHLAFKITEHRFTDFKSLKQVTRFRVTVAALFFDAPDHLLEQSSVDLTDRKVNEKLTGEQVVFTVPPTATAVMIVVKCSGLIENFLSNDKGATGIGIVEVLERSGQE